MGGENYHGNVCGVQERSERVFVGLMRSQCYIEM